MSTLLAPPSRLRLLAVHHAGDDPDLPPGTHCRWLADPALGLPLTPVEIWRVDARPVALDPVTTPWFGPQGQAMAVGDLAAHGEARVWVQAQAQPWPVMVGVQAQASHDQPVEMRLLSTFSRRELARRSSAPCTLAAPLPWQLQLFGRHRTTLRGWAVARVDVLKALEGIAPTLRLGPPVDEAAWHVRGLGERAAWERVEAGAPLQEPWIDRPHAPPQPLSPADERDRLVDLMPEWRDRCRRLLDDADTPPHAVQERHEWAAHVRADGRQQPWQRITGRALETLHAAALDTGLARWLGLMGHLPSVPRTRDERGAEVGEALLMAGVFAEPADAAPGPDELERTLLERRLREQPELAALVDRLPRHGLRARLQVALALNAPLPDRPAAPQPVAAEAHWQRVEGSEEAHFARRLLLPHAPAAALLGVAVLDQGQWQPRHPRSDAAVPRSRIRLPGNLKRSLGWRHGGVEAAIVDEAALPAAGAPWPCSIVLGDLFGRYGAATPGQLEPPPRPAVPTPALRATLRREPSPAPLDEPAPEGEPPPGAPVRPVPAAQPVPDPVWWAEVDVPAPETLAAGTWAVAAVEWSLDGVPLPPGPEAAPPGGGLVQRLIAVAPAPAMQAVTSTVAVRFVDTQGRVGDWSTVSERWVDGRLPAVPLVGQGLWWTSLPGSGEEVTLQLTVPAPAAGQGPAVRCRVYLGDAAALGISALAPDGQARSRAEIGRLAAALPPEQTADRGAFRLALPEPVSPGPDGRCAITVRLPRALQSVQLLRIVPVSDSGQEPGFAACPLLPVAVPTDRRPPAPRVHASFDAQTGALRVRIVAEGLDLVALQADEPGCLQAEPPAGTALPRWRLRLASGAVPRAFYARTLAQGKLRWSDEDAAFVADWSAAREPGGWPAYVPLTLWAEVALPPERRLPKGVELQPWPGGAIEAASPATLLDGPRPFSECSAPARAIRVPAAPLVLDPAASVATAVAVAPQEWLLTLDIVGPALHPKALASCRVEAAQAPADGDWQPVELPGSGALVGGRLQATVRVETAEPARLSLSLIDPLGARQGAVEIAVQQGP